MFFTSPTWNTVTQMSYLAANVALAHSESRMMFAKPSRSQAIMFEKPSWSQAIMLTNEELVGFFKNKKQKKEEKKKRGVFVSSTLVY